MIERLLEAERALSVGLLDQAERLYRQATDADPRNSIAFVGLARVALERGDEPGAHALGLRALEIDSQNQAARRLIDRLVEVRQHRGDPALPPEAAVLPPSRPAERPATARQPATAAAEPTAPKQPAPKPSVPQAPTAQVTPQRAVRTVAPPGPTEQPAQAAPPRSPAASPAPRRPPVAPPAAIRTSAASRPAKRPAAPPSVRPVERKQPGLLGRLFGPRR